MTTDEFAGMNLEDVRRKAEADRKKAESETVKPTAPEKAQTLPEVQPASHFKIDDFLDKRCFPAENGYVLDGVKINGEEYQVYLYKNPIILGPLERLLGGRSFEKWNEHTEDVLASPPTSARVYHAIFKALYENKDNPQFQNMIESARRGLAEILGNHRVVTLTKIKCDYVGNHWVVQGDGGSNHVTDYTPLAPEKCILEEKDPDQVGNIYRWLNRNHRADWNVRHELRDGEEPIFSIAANHAFGDYIVLDAYTKPSTRGYAIGVRIKGGLK